MNGFSRARRLLGLRSILSAGGAAVVLFSATCALAADTEAMAKALTRLDDDWSKAAATRDADRVASFYAEDAIAYPPNEPTAIGRAAAKKVWASYFADPTFSISWKTVHAGVSASGDLGFTTSASEDSFKGPDGKLAGRRESPRPRRKEKDGTWKAIARHLEPGFPSSSEPRGRVIFAPAEGIHLPEAADSLRPPPLNHGR